MKTPNSDASSSFWVLNTQKEWCNQTFGNLVLLSLSYDPSGGYPPKILQKNGVTNKNDRGFELGTAMRILIFDMTTWKVLTPFFR